MENTEKTAETQTATSTAVSVDLSSEQYAFLANWKKTHEQELGIDVPIGAMVRKAVDMAMKSQRSREEKPAGARPPRDGGFADRKPGFGRDRDSKPGFRSGGGRPSFGGGRGGPKFDMTGPKNRTRTFNK